MSGSSDASRRLFDLRTLISWVIGVYGVILTLVGWLDTPQDLEKAQGMPINLWIGIAMLVVALLFWWWKRIQPLH